MVEGRAFGVAGCQVTPLLEAVEAAFHDVALAVDGSVEGGWSAAGAALGGPAGDLVGAFRDDVPDPARSQGASGGVVGVALVRDQYVGTLAGPARSRLVDADRVQQRQELGVVTGLTGVSRIDSGRPRPSTAR